MLKLYYGLSEGETAGRPPGSDPLDPTDLNGAHFDPEVYLDKVCVCVLGEPGRRYIAPPDHAFDFVAGVREAGVPKNKTTLGPEAGAELESKGSMGRFAPS